MKYYTYIYFNPNNMIPFYVGMGKGRRKFSHLKDAISNPTPVSGQHKLNTIRKILREGKEPIINVIDENLSKEQAIELEMFLISFLGRKDLGTGPLTNLTKGGDGFTGWNEEYRKKQSVLQKTLGRVPPSQKGKKQNRRPEYKSIPAIVIKTGKRTKALLTDPRWNTGEIVGINNGVIQDEDWRKKNSEGISKLKWWNNGIKCIRSIDCPGENYVRGRGKVKW